MTVEAIHKILMSFGDDIKSIVAEMDLEAPAVEIFTRADFASFIKKSAIKNQKVWNALTPDLQQAAYQSAKNLARRYALETPTKASFASSGFAEGVIYQKKPDCSYRELQRRM